MSFDELKFEPHEVGDGIQATTFFTNGYGASVVRFNGSYGNENGLYELAVLKGTVADYSINYETPITEDVLGYLSEAAVTETLAAIAEL